MDGKHRWKAGVDMSSVKDLQEKLKRYALSEAEYQMICQKLGRPPEGVEWAIFSALWSEHCSYKSSKKHLKKLFSKHPRVLHGFGENAGVVDLGQGEKIAFKIESHNHPSLIDPYQGAATGVGGILRDIFTLGARPIALANYLCFGELDSSRMKKLLDGVVRGIGGYGNCVGVPMLTGQTEFDSSYNHNILVNAFALGYFGKNDRVFLSSAQGEGYAVVYVGSQTGRDGIHGASMASQPTDDLENVDSRPTVQVGDPFFEKLLIESCLEAMQANLVEAIQDMGASGLTSSSFEMASKGGVGLVMHLDRVPLRDTTLTPEDILLSESQERMLLICRPENIQKLQAIFSKWDLEACPIGQIIQERQICLYWHNKLIAQIDPDILVKQAPEYDRPYQKRSSQKSTKRCFLKEAKSDINSVSDLFSDIRKLSKRFIFQQYDQRVGVNTQRDCGHSVGVLKLPESQRNLGIVLGGRPHIMEQDAFEGGMDAILYPAIQLAIKGFKPLAVTDCLNFGNPENPEVMTQFVDAVEGMDQACRLLQTPIISGNVSFYNEFQSQSITPTPAIGMVGLRDSSLVLPEDHIVEEKCAVLLLDSADFVDGGHRGEMELADLARWIEDLRYLCLSGRVLSSCSVGRWGLGYALCRLCRELGVKLLRDDLPLFQEKWYQVVLIVSLEDRDMILEKFKSEWIGETGGEHIHSQAICWDVKEMRALYERDWESSFGI